MFEALAEAIDTTEIPLDGPSLREALRLADRWAAKLSAVVGSFDAEGLWALDSAASMTAWLRHHAGLVNADAQRMVSAGRSTILDYGRTTRSISPELWAALVIRDKGCRAPWCDRGPEWCQAHHFVHWADGGPTDRTNLGLFCDRDHHLVHQPGWHVKLLPDGTVEITDPRGTVHRSPLPP